MALPDWNADKQAGKQIDEAKWSPCSPTKTTLDKENAARHGKPMGATIADSSPARK